MLMVFISGLGPSSRVWEGCTLSDKEADSEVCSCKYLPHGEYGSLTALILATYIFFSSSLGKRMVNVKSNTGVVSSGLEHFEAYMYDKITRFVLHYSKAPAYTIYIDVPFTGWNSARGVPGVFSFKLHVQPFSLDHERMLVSFLGPPFILRLLVWKDGGLHTPWIPGRVLILRLRDTYCDWISYFT